MKQLFLIRHGEAELSYAGISDHDRELTQKGIIDSTRLGYYLKSHYATFDKIFHSSAFRASTTAQLIAEQMKQEKDILEVAPMLYQTSTGGLHNFICNLEDSLKNVAIIAHNPTLNYFLEYITCESGISFPPAGCTVVEFDVQSWAEITQGMGYLKYTQGM
ncbi:phosphohistidine phosphatase SixA [Limibacter armeniacum]|uniref:phosphohistidine phosphatase SixA n=1 Tax=Limibacter armeniacum TaxID=466084 RepID=UPI002FE50737